MNFATEPVEVALRATETNKLAEKNIRIMLKTQHYENPKKIPENKL